MLIFVEGIELSVVVYAPLLCSAPSPKDVAYKCHVVAILYALHAQFIS